MARLGQFRGDSDSNWLIENPIIAEREFILVSVNAEDAKDYTVVKIGNGTSHYNELPSYQLLTTSTEIDVQTASHIGGKLMLTAASIICTKVEELSTYYRCYMRIEDSEGQKISNLFQVNDQAFVETFNLTKKADGTVGNHFLWRLVISVDKDYIDVSKDICASGSDIPFVGDKIVQLGYRGTDNAGRQTAAILAGGGVGSPYYKQYTGIDSFSLPDEETRLKPGDNLFTGVVNIKEGSNGGENINGLLSGTNNLVRNSGFTGDYLATTLSEDTTLGDETMLYSANLKYWEGSAIVQEDTESASEYSATISASFLSQVLDSLIVGERYVLSFKAKGTTITSSIAGFSQEQVLTAEYAGYEYKFIAAAGHELILSGSYSICEIQLERGTIKSDWKQSIKDNDKAYAAIEAISYISKAIKNGSTTINGGLVLSQIIEVGNYLNGVMTEVTGGLSGIYNSEDDPGLWLGGTLQKAIYTIQFYQDNPTAVPTQEELALMANIAMTHGGRAILNDAIIRGTIYAESGVYKGQVKIAGGKILLNEDGSGQLANGGIIWDKDGNIEYTGKIQTKVDGKRIIIDPDGPFIEMTDSLNRTILLISGYSQGDFFLPSVTLINPEDMYRTYVTHRLNASVWNEWTGTKNMQTFVSAGRIYIAENDSIVWDINKR